MDSITITFNKAFNASLQIGDIIFFKDISADRVYQIGALTAISGFDLTMDIPSATPRPEAGDFIFFAKSNEVNISGLLGYYASVKMELSGSAKKELYAVSTEIFQSS